MQALLEIKVVQVFKDLQASLLIASLLLSGKLSPPTHRRPFEIVDSLDVHVVFPE